MAWKVLIAHAEGEEQFAEKLADPLSRAGYDVVHVGTMMVGQSVSEEASKVLILGGPVVLCGTISAVGTGWVHWIVNAAKRYDKARIFAVQMEEKAYLGWVGADTIIAQFYQDPTKAVDDLLNALKKDYPLHLHQIADGMSQNIEKEFMNQALNQIAMRKFMDQLTHISEFDADQLKKFRKQLREDIRKKYPDYLDPTDFLTHTNFMVNGFLTRSGVLMFGKNPTFIISSAITQCVKYHGSERSAPRESQKLNQTVSEQINAAYDFIISRIRREEKPVSGRTDSTIEYEYPINCIREIIANAITHRNYEDDRDGVHITLFSDRIEIISPGTWYAETLPEATYKSLEELQTLSIKRNFVLAEALSWIKQVEGEGSGIPTAVKDCRDLFAPIPKVIQRSGFVIVTIWPASRQILLDYKKQMLQTYDIIHLASLPEDRNIAAKELKINQLFLPLHVVKQSGLEDSTKKFPIDVSEAYNAKSGIYCKRISVGELLGQSHRLVILGDPGSGKTTLIHWIAVAYLLRPASNQKWEGLSGVGTLPDKDWLPITVRCRDLDQSCLLGTLADILNKTLRKAEISEGDSITLQRTLLNRIREGTALLLFDGLDEISDKKAQTHFCHQLENFGLAYPETPIIITARTASYREMGYRIGRGFEHAVLVDLSREEKDDFARIWCDLVELPERHSEAAVELIHDIHSSDRIERMTGNPMLLTTMALVKRKVGKLPSRRADLYWEAVQVLLHWRSDVDEPLNSHEAIPQLEYIAYAMCDNGVQQLRRDEVLDLITKMRAEYPNLHEVRNHTPEEFLRRLEARTALLVETGKIRYLGMDTSVYMFRHLTFQEYLAARALVDGYFPGRDLKLCLAEQVSVQLCRMTGSQFSAKDIKEAAITESWREVLCLCTTICSDYDVDDVIHAILTPLRDEPKAVSRARAILAVQCLADEPNAGIDTIRIAFRTFSEYINIEDSSELIARTDASRSALEVAHSQMATLLVETLADEFNRRDRETRSGPGGLCGMVYAASIPLEGVTLEKWLIDRAKDLKEGDEKPAIEAALAITVLASEEIVQRFPGLTELLITRLKGSSPMIYAAAWALGRLNKEMKLRGKPWQPRVNHIECLLAFIGDPNADPEAVHFISEILENKKVDAII